MSPGIGKASVNNSHFIVDEKISCRRRLYWSVVSPRWHWTILVRLRRVFNIGSFISRPTTLVEMIAHVGGPRISTKNLFCALGMSTLMPVGPLVLFTSSKYMNHAGENGAAIGWTLASAKCNARPRNNSRFQTKGNILYGTWENQDALSSWTSILLFYL